MPDSTTDRYRRAAEASFERPSIVDTDPSDWRAQIWRREVAQRAAAPWFQAAVDANRERDEAAGREAAAQAIEALYAPKVESDTPGTRATIRSILRQAADIARGEHRG